MNPGGQFPPQGSVPPPYQPPADRGAAEPLEPEAARVRIGYGLLLGLAGMALCCMPIGIIGALLPGSVLANLDTIEDPEIADQLRRRALIALGVCLAATVLSTLGYTFSLIAGCS